MTVTPGDGMPQQVSGIQEVLDIIEARRFKQPSSYEKYAPSPGELNTLIAKLREHDKHANGPVRCYIGNYDGSDWLLGFGSADREDGTGGDIVITTDRVRTSEIRGDAIDDAECYVTLRNNLPRIIGALEKLLARETV